MDTTTYQRSDTYIPGQADVGHRLQVVVTVSNPQGQVTLSSNSTDTISASGPPIPTGRLDRYTFFSPAVGRTQEVYVYLPPGYSANATRKRYPVLYLLHGYPGGPGSFVGGVPAAPIADQLIAQRAIQPVILVMPFGAPDLDTETSWVDGVQTGAWETFLARDVVDWADRCFNTNASAVGRGIAGLSDGGYGALNISLHHPFEFGLVESWSGYDQADPTLTLIYGSDDSLVTYNSPAAELAQAASALRAGRVFFWLYVGSEDVGGLSQNEQFAAQLRLARIPHVFSVFPGSHLPSFYRIHFPLALRVASRHLVGVALRASRREARASDCLPT